MYRGPITVQLIHQQPIIVQEDAARRTEGDGHCHERAEARIGTNAIGTNGDTDSARVLAIANVFKNKFTRAKYAI